MNTLRILLSKKVIFMNKPDTLEYIPCNICGSTDWDILFERDRNQKNVTNVICRQCGLVFVNPRKPYNEIAKDYTDGSFSLTARGSFEPSQAKIYESEKYARERFRILNKCLDLKNIRQGNLLEIGCGVGSFLYLMRAAGWNVQGVEPDAGYAHAGEHEYGIQIKPYLLENMNYKPCSFDIVSMFHVIEHLNSPSEAIAKIRQIVKPNGFVFLECPCIEHPYGGDLEKFFWDSHLYSFSRATLNGLLRLNAFKPLHFGYRNYFLWVIAQRIEDNINSEISYPLDDPKRVSHLTLKSGREFTRLKSINTNSHIFNNASLLLRKTIKALHERPETIIPAVMHKTGLQIGRAKRQLSPFMDRIRKKNKIIHFGLHYPGNAGDTVLFEAVRKTIEIGNSNISWSLAPLWKEVNRETVQHINTKAKAIVIGGGGVLLRDTNPNHNSGWQWNCSVENLIRIKKPIIVFAIGYNRFPDQEEFDPVFKAHITEIVQRSIFFGLRNRMSIRAVSEYLPEHLAKKLKFQPCPTTLLSYLYPSAKPQQRSLEDKRLALNIAFDRHLLRYGLKEFEILSSIARVMKWANRQGWQIDLAIHMSGDDNFIPYLVRENIDFTEVNLEGIPAKDVVRYYQKTPLSIGMRGHSQLIPFGLQNGIISLISHDKLASFLNDIGHPEWGLDINAPDLEFQLIKKIQQFAKHRSIIRDQTVNAQRKLWDITIQNLEIIRKTMEL